METKQGPKMNKVYSAEALRYAECLVAFHEATLFANKSGLREDTLYARVARDMMYDAQNALNAACEKAAQTNVGDIL